MTVTGTVDEQIALVEAAVAHPGSRCVSRVLGNHVDITVVQPDRHRWSPCMQLEFSQSDDDTVINGLVGPHPNTWTLFAFVNITLAIVACFGLMMGFVQLGLGQSMWAFWVVLGAVIAFAGMYFTSQLGRRFAAEQSQMLGALIEGALNTKPE